MTKKSSSKKEHHELKIEDLNSEFTKKRGIERGVVLLSTR
jgi:hypothetical protein